jgi:hypothetical protein
VGRKFVSQKKQTKDEMFDALVKNAIDFLDSSLDDLDKRPKNSIVDFYTSIELFLKAVLMSEHWTLIISKPETANLDSFRVGDFHSLSLSDSTKRLKTILSEPLDQKIVENFKAMGEHRNQIVHFAHTNYTDLSATKAAIVVEQWTSWHYLHELLTVKWKDIFNKYLPEFERIHKRMMLQADFIKARFSELKPKIEIEAKSGKTVIDCEHCDMASGIVSEAHTWGNDYLCMVCGVQDTAVISTNALLSCRNCGKDFEFFQKDITSCPHCGDKLDTNKLIDLCEKEYAEGDAWCEEEMQPHIASCHECQNERPSVFYIDGHWSCVSCFDRGWKAISCPHCDEFVTGDMETIKYVACFKCEDRVRAELKADGF